MKDEEFCFVPGVGFLLIRRIRSSFGATDFRSILPRRRGSSVRVPYQALKLKSPIIKTGDFSLCCNYTLCANLF